MANLSKESHQGFGFLRCELPEIQPGGHGNADFSNPNRAETRAMPRDDGLQLDHEQR